MVRKNSFIQNAQAILNSPSNYYSSHRMNMDQIASPNLQRVRRYDKFIMGVSLLHFAVFQVYKIRMLMHPHSTIHFSTMII